MKIKLLIISLCLFYSFTFATSLPDSLNVSIDDNIHVGSQMLYFEDTTNTLGAVEVLAMFNANKGIRPKSPNPNFGITNSTYWAYLIITNTARYPIDILAHVDNFLMDTTRCFEIMGNGHVKLLGEAGDYLPFAIRPISNRNILFPITLAPKETKAVLISVFKDHSSVSLPIKIWNRGAFYKQEQKDTLLYGIYFGIMLLILLYSLFLFMNIRENYVLYYFLYVVFLSLFQLNHLGFAFQYLWPNSSFLPNFGFWVMDILMTIFFITFARSFTKLKEVSPLLNFYFKVITYFLLAFMVIVLIAPSAWVKYISIAKNLYYYIQLTSALGFIVMVVLVLNKGSVEGKYFSFAFGALLLFGTVYILREVGIAPYNGFTQNALIMGSLIEVLIFSVGITHLVNIAFVERQKLAEKLQEQQEELMISTIKTEEKERQRVSSELHDSIGSQLSFLKVSIEQSQTDKDLIQQVDGLAETVRRISHEMTPIVLEMDGLKPAIINLVDKLNISSETKFYLEWVDFPDDIEEIRAITIYRIVQEASTNIIKHANAKEAYFHFTGYSNEIVIVIEDDGRGFGKATSKGIGLKNMKNRVSHLRGEIDVSSQPESGTSIVISFPV